MEVSKRMLVLVGLPGSGKTTFATKLAATLPEWKRVNQDDLGSRPACEHATKRHISKVGCLAQVRANALLEIG
jgi:adenylate kinase family enzyme